MTIEVNFTIIERRGFQIGLWLHTANDPPQDEWERAFAMIDAAKTKAPLERFRQVIVTDGGAPNMRQRGQLFTKLFEAKPVKSVALTTTLSNPVKRGIVQAVLWTNPAFWAMAPAQWEEGLTRIDLEGEYDIFNEFAKLEPGLSAPSMTLPIIKKSIAARFR